MTITLLSNLNNFFFQHLTHNSPVDNTGAFIFLLYFYDTVALLNSVCRRGRKLSAAVQLCGAAPLPNDNFCRSTIGGVVSLSYWCTSPRRHLLTS